MIISIALKTVGLPNIMKNVHIKGAYDFWQCTNTGKVDGITGNVDIDFKIDSSITEVLFRQPVKEQKNMKMVSGIITMKMEAWQPVG